MSNAGGPYRIPSLPHVPPKARPYLAVAVGTTMFAGLVYLLWPALAPVGLEASDVPPVLLDGLTAFPAPEADLPIATPLAPLLAADGPDSLVVLSPSEGSMRLRRGDAVTVRFNRPMVPATRVGRPSEDTPLVFTPAVDGATRWLSRSTLSFTPSATAFDRSLEAHLSFAEDLTSIDGEPLVDESERVMVFDGTPRASSWVSTVPVGSPLEVHFDAPVTAAALARELFVYERGGGARTLPVTIRSRGWVSTGEGESETRSFVVALDLRRTLEAGASIGVALAPRFSSWGGSTPYVLGYQLEARPHIDGIDCEAPGNGWASCSYEGSPGEIVDIGDELYLRASHPLAGPPTVSVVPTVPNLQITVDTADSERAHFVRIAGDWAADQVYELRITSALTTATGARIAPIAPLAIRSRGHAPQVDLPTGLLTLEVDAPLTFPLRGIHIEAGRVRYWPIAPERAVAELLGVVPAAGSSAAPLDVHSVALSALIPSARTNRWGRGELRMDAPDGPGFYRVVAQAGSSADDSSGLRAFVQRTDLAISTLSVPDGLAVWVTSVASAAARAGVTVSVFDQNGVAVGEGRTDASGLAWLAPTGQVAVLMARGESDRALLRVDDRTAVSGTSLNVGGGGGASGVDLIRAIVRADRGLYRPGEALHLLGLVRRVSGVTLTPLAGDFEVRLVDPASGVGLAAASSDATSSPLGMLQATLRVPADCALGETRVEVRQGAAVIGSAIVRVAQYREPRFRVEVEAEPHLVLGETTSAVVRGTYLFGAPLDGATASVTVNRQTGATFPPRWRDYTFAPVATPNHRSTLVESTLELSAAGEVMLPLRGELAATTRSVLTIEADVVDSAGQSSAASTRVVIHPASIEVGLHAGPEWVRSGEALSAEVIAIDALDEPVLTPVTVHFAREGWHAWWEWHDGSEEELEGDGYALRRASRREVMHTCHLRSEMEPVTCEFVPSRPGTYLIEVQAEDDAGRRSIASRRVYVAGADESPDRDPPGAPIEITPHRSTASVGSVVELAFENPWPEAEALIVVSQDGVLHSERRHVGPGGQIFSVPVTEAMAPSAFVTLTLVRPRTGAPGGALDLHAPDLRFGAAELAVRAPLAPLHVVIAPAVELRPGVEHGLEVTVTDEAGAPVSVADVAIWASDEGTLRATGYQLGSLDEDLFPRLPSRFALEDSRRALRSRLDPLIEADPSGDGGGSSAAPMALTVRERYEPTPLFFANVRTDERGRVRVPFMPPDRLTEYHIFAVATDMRARVGSAESSRVVTQDVLLRTALPPFLTEGDTAELQVFVHNRTDTPKDLDVVLSVDGAADAPVRLSVPAHGELHITRMIEAATLASIATHVEARAPGGVVMHALDGSIAVVPRGRWERRSALVMGADGTRSMGIALPTGASSRGSMDVVVAAHPFVGLPALADDVDRSAWSTGLTDAAAVLALSAAIRLEGGSVSGIERWRERHARLERRLEHLQRLINADGGIARYPGEISEPSLDLLVLRAWMAAGEAGVEVPEEALAGLTERLADDVREGRFGGTMGDAGMTAKMAAIRLLRTRGVHVDAFIEAAFATREFLGVAGLAELALTLDASDARRSTVIALLESRAGIERSGMTRASLDARGRSISELSALIRLESHLLTHARATDPSRGTRRLLSPLAGALLAQIEGASLLDRADALSALVEVAERFRGADAPLLSLTLDGAPVTAERSSEAAAHFTLPFESIRSGEHALLARRGVPEDDDHAPVFMSLSALWTVPISDVESMARGRGVSLHRVYETPGGARIEPGAVLPMGALVRVRLFVHVEGGSPEEILLRDPHPAGLSPIDADLRTSPNAALLSVLGASPSDDTQDPRAYHALRSEWVIRHRAHETHATTFYLRAVSPGLHEFTYVVRATTVGTFTAAPAQIEALDDDTFLARSTAVGVGVTR
jgi:hypothetical protein